MVPGESWISDGILHVRGEECSFVFISGDFVGGGTVVNDVNRNVVTGHGTGIGRVVLNVEWGELSGTFEGHTVLKIGDRGLTTNNAYCHGTGDFEGMTSMSSFVVLGPPVPGTLIVENGVILDPHGE